MNVSHGAHRRANARRARRRQVLPPTELRALPPATLTLNRPACDPTPPAARAGITRWHTDVTPVAAPVSPRSVICSRRLRRPDSAKLPGRTRPSDSSGPHVLRKQAHTDRGAASLTLSRGLLLLLGLDREGPRRGAPCESGGRDGQHTAGTKAMMGGAPPSERC